MFGETDGERTLELGRGQYHGPGGHYGEGDKRSLQQINRDMLFERDTLAERGEPLGEYRGFVPEPNFYS